MQGVPEVRLREEPRALDGRRGPLRRIGSQEPADYKQIIFTFSPTGLLRTKVSEPPRESRTPSLPSDKTPQQMVTVAVREEPSKSTSLTWLETVFGKRELLFL